MTTAIRASLSCPCRNADFGVYSYGEFVGVRLPKDSDGVIPKPFVFTSGARDLTAKKVRERELNEP
jgi:hypothetical protein